MRVALTLYLVSDMETPLSLRFQELRPKLDKRAKRSGMSKADMVRLAVFLLLQNHKTDAALYVAQSKFLAKAGA